MDVGDLFVLANYHHLVGGNIDLDGIIHKHLRKVVYPSRLISTRHIFRLKLTERATTTLQSTEKCDNFCNKNHRKGLLCPPTLKETPPDHARVVQSSSQRNDSFSFQGSVSSMKNPKRQHEVSTLNTSGSTLNTSGNVSNKAVKLERSDLTDQHVQYRQSEGLNLKAGQSNYFYTETRNHELQGHNQGNLLTAPSTEMIITPLSGHGSMKSGIAKKTEPVAAVQESGIRHTVCQNKSLCDNGLNLRATDADVDRMEKIIRTLVKAQAGYDEVPPEKPSTSQRMDKGTIDKYKNLVGERSEEDLRKIEVILQFLQHKIKQIVKFSKSIPGFGDLSVHDRLTLMKASKSESQMLGTVVIDHRTRTFQMTTSERWSAEELRPMFPQEYLEQVFLITHKLEALQLSEREMAVIRAMIITFPDREGLEDKESVMRVNQQLRDCLLHILKQDVCPNIPYRLQQIDDVLKFMRELTAVYNHVLVSVLEKGKMMENFDLIQEFFFEM